MYEIEVASTSINNVESVQSVNFITPTITELSFLPQSNAAIIDDANITEDFSPPITCTSTPYNNPKQKNDFAYYQAFQIKIILYTLRNTFQMIQSLEGRRIVDIQHLFKQIQNSRHDRFGCSFLDMEFINEFRRGFSSIFKYKCKMCGIQLNISSEIDQKSESINLLANKSSIRIGYTQLSELCSSAELPFLSSTAYLKHLSNTAIDEMLKAGNEERQLAIESGNIDQDGIPMCTVIADGQRSKRSYKTKLNAFSGATKKYLFVGLRNSYCSVCQRAMTIKEEPPTHKCFLNWKMSSTVAANKTNYSIFIRKFITLNILRFRSDVTKSIDYHKKTDVQQFIMIVIIVLALRRHIFNSIYHRLGQHSNCAGYFCSGSKNEETNLVPEAEKTGIMTEMRKIVYRLTINADSLIENVDNNPCEQFSSIINKHIGAKRINFTQGHNYQTRVEAAVIAYNSKNYIRAVHKKIMTKSPERIRNKTTTRRKKLFDDGHKQTKLKSKFSGPNVDGLAEPLDNCMPIEELEKRNSF
ncbi:hypothetical protein AGLY_017146 [Aphis glycines]|uniref:Mutator-like transposase domain-containing protein n=1 Tax=Aphis glycines TaxID=307491 RepID=A0A6G0SWL4_APHGL|nr:hypothetical protein AGLY_017146 [Aphis glycines]